MIDITKTPVYMEGNEVTPYPPNIKGPANWITLLAYVNPSDVINNWKKSEVDYFLKSNELKDIEEYEAWYYNLADISPGISGNNETLGTKAKKLVHKWSKLVASTKDKVMIVDKIAKEAEEFESEIVDIYKSELEIAKEKEREGDWTTMDYAYGNTGANWFSNDKKGTSKSKSKNPSYFTGSKACPVHDGTTVVFKRNYKHLSGAQGGEVAIDSELKLVVDLAGLFKSKPDLKAIEFTKGTTYTDGTWEKDMSNLNAHVRGPAVLRIENPDMKIPPVGFSFWKELWNLLPKGRTVCCCVGGHGRTGTALAALLLAADKQLDAKAAISLVRKKHCEKAIESSMQERYLKLLAKERDASV